MISGEYEGLTMFKETLNSFPCDMRLSQHSQLLGLKYSPLSYTFGRKFVTLSDVYINNLINVSLYFSGFFTMRILLS